MTAGTVTRFAPSPTGELHLGNVRTALHSLLLARQRGGIFLLRIEDTDAARGSAAHLAALYADLAWLGLDWDEGPGREAGHGPYLQSARDHVYAPLYASLEAAGHAYPCYCTAAELELSRRAQRSAGRPPRYAGTCAHLDAAARAAHAAAGRRPTLRFRVPQSRTLAFDDLVHGEQRIDSATIGDFVIRREDGSAAFLYANAVDDSLMMVTDVLRGEDHLPNTPRQLLLLEALGMRAPRYGHLPLINGSDGAPLSKRNGAQSVRELREAGYAPAAILNLLYRIGHSTPLQELLPLEGMARGYDIAHLQRAAARLDPVQLRHWQGAWVRGLSAADAGEWLAHWLPAGLDGARRAAVVQALLPNIVAGAEARAWVPVLFGGELEFEPDARSALEATPREFFAGLAAAAGERPQVEALRAASALRGAKFYAPLRAVLTGRLHGPELGPLLAAMEPGVARARLAAQAARGC